MNHLRNYNKVGCGEFDKIVIKGKIKDYPKENIKNI